MLTFENLNNNHIEAAAQLALAEYFEEQKVVPILPSGDYFNLFCDLILKMVEHRLGVVAMEAGKLLGFLTCYNPCQNHFGATMGTFSPIHAHGAIKNDRKRIYSQMYQKAAQKWVSNGILSHPIPPFYLNRWTFVFFISGPYSPLSLKEQPGLTGSEGRDVDGGEKRTGR